MKNYLTILMVVLFLACSSNKIPKGILNEKQMVPVIIELHLAESIYTQRYALDIKRENFQEDLYLSILKKYKLNKKDFEASILYYGKHPDKYRLIYDEVLNRLNEMDVKSRAKDNLQLNKSDVKVKAKDSIQIKK